MDPKRLGAALLVGMLLLGACSSGGSSDEGAEESTEADESDSPEETPSEVSGPTPEEFIAEAEEVCISSSKEAVAANVSAGIPATKKADFALGKELIAIRQSRIDRLESVEPPEELESDFDAYLQTRQASADLIQERFDAIKDGKDKLAAKLLDKVESNDDKWQVMAEKIGFEACASKLDPEAEKEVTATVTQFFEGDVAKTCKSFVTKAYLKYLGGNSGCVQALTTSPNVKVSEVEGVSGVDASATVTGSSYEGRISVGVIVEGGKYKVRSFYFL